MRLQAVPFDADPHTAADWLEMKAMLSPRDKVAFADIERSWEANRISEDEDPSGGDVFYDQWLNERLDVIQRRMDLLGSAYPFEFCDNETALRFLGSAELVDGRAVYLLSLFLSVASNTIIFVNKLPITKWMRDTFQTCSGWAASGAIEGSSYVFGWPRSDGSNFVTALKHVYVNLMADGEILPRDTAPPGASGREKDGGIDVVAWKARIDKAGGKLHLLGQVASGANWRDKPITPYIDSLQKLWLTQQWILPPVHAMFIPFSIVPEPGITYAEQVRFHSATYGAIFYREVLAAYAQRGLELGRSGAVLCHRSSELATLISKSRSLISVLKRAQLRP